MQRFKRNHSLAPVYRSTPERCKDGFWDVVKAKKAVWGDKPGKSADFYHTCYCLSGLSVAQWYGELPVLAGGNATAKERKANVVEKTNVLLNVVESKYTNWMDNFGGDIDMEWLLRHSI